MTWRGKKWALLCLLGLAVWAAAPGARRGPILRMQLDFETRAGLQDLLDAGQLGKTLAARLGVGLELVEPAEDASSTLEGLRGPLSLGITRVGSYALASKQHAYRALYVLPKAKPHELLVLADRSRPVVWSRGLTTPFLERGARMLLAKLGQGSSQLAVQDVYHEALPPRMPGDARAFRWMEPLLRTLLDGKADVVIAEAGRVRQEASPAQLARLKVVARFRGLSTFVIVVPREASPALLAALEQTLAPEVARLRLEADAGAEVRPLLAALASRLIERTDEPFLP